MYTITFSSDTQDAQVQSTSKILDCNKFSQILYQSPSDRHAYALKFLKNPVSIGRLSSTTKDFVKFAR
jgi:hypothetical protein